jgi:hypothetical protein
VLVEVGDPLADHRGEHVLRVDLGPERGGGPCGGPAHRGGLVVAELVEVRHVPTALDEEIAEVDGVGRAQTEVRDHHVLVPPDQRRDQRTGAAVFGADRAFVVGHRRKLPR